MKTIIIMSITIFLSFACLAQSDSTMNRKTDRNTDYKTREMSKTDGVTMKNGTMMTVKNGKMTSMTTDVVYKDGTRVSTKGLVSKNGDSATMLKEGEYIDVYGKVIPVNNSKTSSDKNKSKTSKNKNMYLVPDTLLRNNK